MLQHKVAWLARVVFAVVLLAVVIDAAPPAASGSPLRGVIRGANGETLEGVAVSMRPVGKTFTMSVFTDEQGEYLFPPLEEPFTTGQYRVWAQAVGYESAHSELAVGGTRPARQDLALKTIKDFTMQLSGAEWMDALPAETREDRRIKEIFRVNCTECHQAGLVFQNKLDERGWASIIEVMSRASYHGYSGPTARVSPTIQYHKDELAKYLARVRGPGPSPMKFKLRPRPRGEAARHVVIEYGIPIAELPEELATIDGSEWSEGIPSGMRGGGGMHDVAIDNNGNAWVTDSVANKFRTVAKIETKTGKVTGYKLTGADGVSAISSHGIYKDRKGIIWFTAGGGLGRVDPSTEAFDYYKPPAPVSGGGSLEEDGKGKLWLPARHGGLQFDPETKKWRYFQAKTIGDGGTYGAAGDALGNGWWAQHNQDIVGHANPVTGQVDDVKMNPPFAKDADLTPADQEFYNNNGIGTFTGTFARPGGQFPRRMSSDRQGAIWVANWWGNNLAKIDIRTLKPTYYQLPFPSHPYATVVDKNQMVWTNLSSDDAVARFNPKTEEWMIFKLPSLGAELRYISVDEAADVWVVYREASKVTRIHPRTQAEIQALKQATTN